MQPHSKLNNEPSHYANILAQESHALEHHHLELGFVPENKTILRLVCNTRFHQHIPGYNYPGHGTYIQASHVSLNSLLVDRFLISI